MRQEVYENLSPMIAGTVPNLLKWVPSRPHTHKSSKTKLLVSGCSFTATHYEFAAMTWPGFVMDYCRFDHCFCYGVPGAGNQYIGDSIISHLRKLSDDEVRDYTVIVMWSGPERTMRLSPDSGKNPVLDGVSYIRVTKESESENLRLLNESAAKILELKEYLTRRNIQYVFTTYVNVLFPPYLPKRDGCIEFDKYVDRSTLRALKEIAWIPTKPMDFMFEYGFVHDSLSEDMFHPGKICHDEWVKNVLLPGMEQQGLITRI